MYQMSLMGFRLSITYPLIRTGLMDADANWMDAAHVIRWN